LRSTFPSRHSESSSQNNRQLGFALAKREIALTQGYLPGKNIQKMSSEDFTAAHMKSLYYKKRKPLQNPPGSKTRETVPN